MNSEDLRDTLQMVVAKLNQISDETAEPHEMYLDIVRSYHAYAYELITELALTVGIYSKSDVALAEAAQNAATAAYKAQLARHMAY